MIQRIPVTVLTGYLGAGKTTLLNRVLATDHGRRWAVIVNEFGEIGIDAELIVHADEEVFQMSNGCVCCTVRGDLVRTLHGLLTRRPDFDAIIVETTGLAAPAPVAQTFLTDHALQAGTVLDSIVTVADSLNVLARIEDSSEAREQIAFADQIVLNKTDLVSSASLGAAEAAIRGLNRIAPIHRCCRGVVDLSLIIGQGSFDLDRIEAITTQPALNPPHGAAGHRHGADCDAHEHRHDHDIVSVSLEACEPLDLQKLSAWLEGLVARQGSDILRLKGVIDIAGEERRFVVQAVHMVMEGDFQRPWRDAERRSSRLVLIGRHLDAATLRRELEACAAG